MSIIYHLMLVDDERRIVRGLSNAIKASGLPFSEVAGFHSVNEALEEMSCVKYDVLITDIRMPERDGLDLVREIRQCFPECLVIFLTGYGQFEYAQQAIKYGAFDFLLKPVTDELLFQCLERAIAKKEAESSVRNSMESLRVRLEESIPLLRRDYLQDRLKGESNSATLEELLNKGRELGLTVELARPVRLMVIRVDNRQKLLDTYPGESLEIRICEEAMRASASGGVNAEWTEADGCYLCIVQYAGAGSQEDERIRLKRVAEELRASLIQNWGIEISVLLSGSAAGIAEWAPVFAHAIQGLRQRISTGAGLVLDIDGDPISPGTVEFTRIKSLSALEPLLEAMDEEGYLAHLHDVFQEARAISDMPYRVFIELSQRISLLLIRSVNKLHPKELEEAELPIAEWANVNRFSSLEEMEHAFTDASKRVIQLLRNREKDEIKEMMNRLKWLIARNLSGDLSLTTLAMQAHVSAPYLSRLFKEQTGEGINHYVTRIRIERAIELLRDPKLKIGEVAIRTGYDNIPYFTKVFKKVVGKTPQEFKKT